MCMLSKHVLYLAACTADKFDCGNGRCLDWSQVCDYADDCSDLSDEKNCSYPAGQHSAFRSFTCFCLPIAAWTSCCATHWWCNSTRTIFYQRLNNLVSREDIPPKPLLSASFQILILSIVVTLLLSSCLTPQQRSTRLTTRSFWKKASCHFCGRK